MRLKIIKIKNQLVLPLPGEVIENLELTEGSEVEVTIQDEEKWILMSSATDSQDLEEVDEQYGEMMGDLIDEFKSAFEKLADEYSGPSSKKS
jgi:antitoxin component of MazEF toxin-antitoxin module